MGPLTVLTGMLGKSDCIPIAYSIQQYPKYSDLSLVNPRFLIYAMKQLKEKDERDTVYIHCPLLVRPKELTMVAHRPC